MPKNSFFSENASQNGAQMVSFSLQVSSRTSFVYDFCVLLMIFVIPGYDSPPRRPSDLIFHDFRAVFGDFSWFRSSFSSHILTYPHICHISSYILTYPHISSYILTYHISSHIPKTLDLALCWYCISNDLVMLTYPHISDISSHQAYPGTCKPCFSCSLK